MISSMSRARGMTTWKPAVAVDLHEAGLGQPQQGLPHRAAGDLEQVGELVDGVGLVRDAAHRR